MTAASTSRARGLVAFSTPFDDEAVDFLAGLDMPAFKIASADLTCKPLLERVARAQKPVILSTGTSTLAMAQAEPDIDVVAVEVYRRGLAQLLSAIDREGVTNIRLVRGDGVDVLERMFTTATLTGVRVFFPDPWPKSRHHKRRLLQARTVGLIADRLVPGGLLHAATDHAGYAEHIAAVGDAETRLRRVPATEALPISVHRPITKYETKARHAGSEVTELLWVRRP